MKLFDHVSELLYDHNCVIVPGFGGFVANFKATERNEDSGMVKPARKLVAFNQNLTENDGLLTQYVAKKLGIPYPEAEAKVAEMVLFIRTRLDQYRNFEFRNVGTIYLNKEEKLVFVPYENHNFYAKSYGLPEIKVRPFRTETVHRKRKSGSLSSGRSQSTAATSIRWRVAGLAATLLFFAGAGFLGYKFSDPNSNNAQYAAIPETEALGSIITIPPSSSADTELVKSEAETDLRNEDTDHTDIATSVSDADVNIAPETTVYEYHIIVATATDAAKAREMTKGSGFEYFDTEIIENQHAGEILISIESFSTRKFAEQYLAEIQANNFNHAYILELAR